MGYFPPVVSLPFSFPADPPISLHSPFPMVTNMMKTRLRQLTFPLALAFCLGSTAANAEDKPTEPETEESTQSSDDEPSARKSKGLLGKKNRKRKRKRKGPEVLPVDDAPGVDKNPTPSEAVPAPTRPKAEEAKDTEEEVPGSEENEDEWTPESNHGRPPAGDSRT